MEKHQIKKLLDERRAYMLSHCPAYRVDCALTEALRPILSQWPEPLGSTFRAYDRLLADHALAECAATFELGRTLARRAAERGFIPSELDTAAQEDFLASLAYPQELRTLRQSLAEQAELSPPREHLNCYLEVIADQHDYEKMFCSWFGCEAEGVHETYTAWVRSIIEPDGGYDCLWWAAGTDE